MKFNNIKNTLQTWGFWRGFYFYLMSVSKRHLTLCQVHLRAHSNLSKMPALEKGFEVRLVGEQELLECCDDAELQLGKKFITEAFERGDICSAALYKGRLASYVWFAFESAPHVHGLWVDFDKNYRYGYKAFTRPAFRKKQLQHAINMFIDKLMLERGKSHGIGFIETHNYPSLISNFRRGNRRVGYAGYVELWGKIMTFRSRGAKKHGFRFYLPSKTNDAC